MDNQFKKRPVGVNRPAVASDQRYEQTSEETHIESNGTHEADNISNHANQSEAKTDSKPPKRKNLLLKVVGVVMGVALLAAAIFIGWYIMALRPVSSEASEVEVQIASGSTPAVIGEKLQSSGVIRSSTAFLIDSRIQGAQASLKSGVFNLNPADSTSDIIKQLVKGPDIETVDITFLPGGTIDDHAKELVRAGYSESEVENALSASYDHPLLATKPVSSDLEGYLYGETHQFNKGTPLSTVLTRYFDDYYKIVQDNNLIEGYKEQGLTLHEGIILASIIEREVSCRGSNVCDDQKKVAQVFYKRLAEDISLGADATFMYAAKKEGKTPTVDFDSPYNTRIHRGLTPGPISSPGLGALLAVADPAEGDYLFFVSGDDGVNYFSKTEAEHIDNTRKHCDVNCRIPQ